MEDIIISCLLILETPMKQKLNYKCPVEGCKGRNSTIDLLAEHLTIITDSRHEIWRRENGIVRASRLNAEIRPEIRKILEESMQWNPKTNLYEFY
jgi:hypothetical protein